MPKPHSFRKVSILFSYLFMLNGVLSLIGWIADITFLKSITEGWVTVKVNTAIWLILSGITLFLWNKRIKTLLVERVIDILSSIVFLMSCLTVLEYSFGFTTGIDELFIKGEINEIGSNNPGRPIPIIAVSFLLFNFTFLPWVRNNVKSYYIQSNYFLIGVLSFIAGTSYMLGTSSDNFTPAYAYLSIYTGVSCFIIMLAGLFSRPDEGIMKQISSDTVGGSIFRKTFFFFIPGLVILGWLRILGAQKEWYSVEHSKGIVVVIALVCFALIMYLSSAYLTKSEQQLSKNENDLLQANTAFEKAEELAKIGSWEIDTSGALRKKKWSKQMFRLFGLKPTETAPPFSAFLQLLHPEDRELVKDIYNEMDKGVVPENRIFRSNPKRGDVKYYQPTLHIIKNDEGVPYKYFGTIQCVTERKIIEQKLKAREELFSKSFHSKIFGLAIVNKERQIVDINETLTSLLGVNRDDIIGKTSVEIGLTDPEYIKKRDELLIIILMNGRLDNYELDLITNRGKPMSFLLSVEPMQLNDEQHWLIYLKDVTEKRMAERKVKESENRLRTILDTDPECVKIIDLNGELAFMNPAGLAMLEADSFEMVKGRKALEYIHTPYLKKFYELVTYVFSGNTAKMEYEITSSKGTHKWMETHMVPLRDAKQKINSLLSVTRDITERKKSEEAIQKGIERYELLGKATNDAVWQWELQTNDLWGNDSFYKLYGLNKEVDSLKDLEPYSRAHPDEVVHLKASLENSFKKKESFNEVEYRFMMPEGFYKTFLDRTFISYDDNGKPVRLIGAMLDITEAKKSEEQVKSYNIQLQQLAANLQNIREEERSRIGREIHDELGQWLTVLKMQIARVGNLKGNEEKLNESITEMLKQVDGCIQSSRRIATELRPTIIDDLGLIAALEWQADEFGLRSNVKSIFSTDIEKLDLPPNFTIGIFRIFQESLTNIARHAEATIVTSNLYFDNDNLILKIADNGKGFDTSIIGTKKTLGLIGMKERTLLMNGSYSINSSATDGTEITVTIPIPVG